MLILLLSLHSLFINKHCCPHNDIADLVVSSINTGKRYAVFWIMVVFFNHLKLIITMLLSTNLKH